MIKSRKIFFIGYLLFSTFSLAMETEPPQPSNTENEEIYSSDEEKKVVYSDDEVENDYLSNDQSKPPLLAIPSQDDFDAIPNECANELCCIGRSRQNENRHGDVYPFDKHIVLKGDDHLKDMNSYYDALDQKLNELQIIIESKNLKINKLEQELLELPGSNNPQIIDNEKREIKEFENALVELQREKSLLPELANNYIKHNKLLLDYRDYEDRLEKFKKGELNALSEIERKNLQENGSQLELLRQELDQLNCRINGLEIEIAQKFKKKYMNASYIDPNLLFHNVNKNEPKITTLNFPHHYIATQAPMAKDRNHLKGKKGTISKFWSMVWHHEIPVIVMLTDYYEQTAGQAEGVYKAERYFDDAEGRTQTYGSIIVETMNIENRGDVKITKLKLTKDNKERFVYQLHFRNWKDDTGVSVNDMNKLLALKGEYFNEAKKLNKGDVSNTVLVHCSAGIGRTGAFILMDAYKTYFDQIKTIDDMPVLSNVIQALRSQRASMVKTWSQHISVVEFINALYQSWLKKNMVEEKIDY